MLSLQSRVVILLLLLTQASEAIPRRDERNARDGLSDLQYTNRAVAMNDLMDAEEIGAKNALSTDYRTMPPGTYTETISTGLVRVVIVNNPTPTTTTRGNCPDECDCTWIKDKESPEYFQCVTNAGCIPCREHGLTSSPAKPKPTCPANCDLTDTACGSCRTGEPSI